MHLRLLHSFLNLSHMHRQLGASCCSRSVGLITPAWMPLSLAFVEASVADARAAQPHTHTETHPKLDTGPEDFAALF